MTELLFVFTVVFVGYVLYEVFKTVSRPAPAAQTHAACEPSPTVTAVAEEAVAEWGEMAAVPVAAEPVEIVAAEDKAVSLRNPATGETAAVPTNYRFAKKWIKEALVVEGLLDRIYKNAELDEAATQKVKEALEQFKGLAKYHG